MSAARSAGRTLDDGSLKDVDIALFAAGGAQSKQYGPSAVESGAIVIDNSSAFRMHPDVPLVVPEINPSAALSLLHGDQGKGGMIANPNCSTIMMSIAVWPIYKAAGIERMVVSTYQSASGAGMVAMHELERQAKEWVDGSEMSGCFGKQYLWNLFSHNSGIDAATGYNEEELKMIKETKKIFGDDELRITESTTEKTTNSQNP